LRNSLGSDLSINPDRGGSFIGFSLPSVYQTRIYEFGLRF
jgi:hypothetical protein